MSHDSKHFPDDVYPTYMLHQNQKSTTDQEKCLMINQSLDKFSTPVILLDNNFGFVWENESFSKLDLSKKWLDLSIDAIKSESNCNCPHRTSLNKTIEIDDITKADINVTFIYYEENLIGYMLFIEESDHKNQQLRELEKAARTDSLTGLANRLSFVSRLDHQYATSQRTGKVFCLIYIDLDKFKPINDTFGHKAGDTVLMHFSKSVKREIRQNDFAARLGGDEFAIIIDDTKDAAENIINRLINRDECLFNDKPLDYCFSYGFSEFSCGKSIDDILDEADKSMYNHKKTKTADNVKVINRYLGVPLEKRLKIKLPFPLTLEFINKNTIDNIQDTEIKVSEIHGYGLFATKEIEANKTLCVLTGQIMSKDEYRKLVDSLTPMLGDLSFYFLMECSHLQAHNMLKVRSFRTKWSYINHSINPNVFFDVATQELYTLRNIKKGEELTFDYRVEPLDENYLKSNSYWLEGEYL